MNGEILKDFDRELKEYEQLRTIDRIMCIIMSSCIFGCAIYAVYDSFFK